MYEISKWHDTGLWFLVDCVREGSSHENALESYIAHRPQRAPAKFKVVSCFGAKTFTVVENITEESKCTRSM